RPSRMPSDAVVAAPIASPILGSNPNSAVHTGASITPSRLMNSCTRMDPTVRSSLGVMNETTQSSETHRAASHRREQVAHTDDMATRPDHQRSVDGAGGPWERRARLGADARAPPADRLEAERQRVVREPMPAVEHELRIRKCTHDAEAGNRRARCERPRSARPVLPTSDEPRVDA